MSANFYSCFLAEACLGGLYPHKNPVGNCVNGYHGELCNVCDLGYSKSSSSQRCSLCSSLVSTVILFVLLFLGLVVALTIIVRQTIRAAKEKKNFLNVYLRILFNHMQLVIIIASFKLEWPPRVESVFSVAAPVSDASTSIMNIDCIIMGSENKMVFSEHPFLAKLLVAGLLPLYIMLIAKVIWQICYCSKMVDKA